jgi:hypothetical protein
MIMKNVKNELVKRAKKQGTIISVVLLYKPTGKRNIRHSKI